MGHCRAARAAARRRAPEARPAAVCAGLLENFVRRQQGGERGGRRPLYDLRRDGPVRTVLKLTKLDYKDADLRDHGLNLGRNRAQQTQDSGTAGR